MNNSEIPHLWANQSRPSAKNGKGTLFFEGDTIYSYGRHFPIAKLAEIEGVPVVFFNPARYSVTTGKHQSKARQAVHGREIHYLNPSLWYSVTTRAELERALETQAVADAASAESEKARKRERARQARKERKERPAREAARLAEYQERKEREAAAIEAYPAELEAWRNGGPLPRANNYHNRPTTLRLTADGKRIETSRGAFIPVSVARKAWPFMRDAVAEKRTPLEMPGFKWGDYTGLALGTDHSGASFLHVGCHIIPFSEVELIAARLGLLATASA